MSPERAALLAAIDEGEVDAPAPLHNPFTAEERADAEAWAIHALRGDDLEPMYGEQDHVVEHALTIFQYEDTIAAAVAAETARCATIARQIAEQHRVAGYGFPTNPFPGVRAAVADAIADAIEGADVIRARAEGGGA